MNPLYLQSQHKHLEECWKKSSVSVTHSMAKWERASKVMLTITYLREKEEKLPKRQRAVHRGHHTTVVSKMEENEYD